MIRVLINGQGRECQPDLPVLEVLRRAGVLHRPDCKILVTRRKGEEEPKEYLMETTKGSLVFRVEEGALGWWRENFRLFQGKEMWWETAQAVVFGPVDLRGRGLVPGKGRRRLEEGELFLGFGGFDPSQAFLGLARRPHEGVYGIPEGFVLGEVVRGEHVLDGLGRGDQLLSVSPLVRERRETVRGNPAFLRVEEGMEIFTFVEVNLLPEAVRGAEHLLGVLREGVFRVDWEGSSFLSMEGVPVDGLPPENTVMRFRGAVTVRNAGKRAGALYLYRRDAPPSPHHSVVGRVGRGEELLDHACRGERLLVRTVPRRLVVVGMTQGEASRLLGEEGIRHVRVGDERDEALIIEQRPEFSLEVKREGVVATLGVDPVHVVRIRLWEDRAPRSVAHFRALAEMVTSPVGKLSIIARTEEVVLLSSVRGRTFRPVSPENVAEGEVEEGVLGITNSFRRLTGLAGVRLKPSRSFGPTGEALEATNLIGRVIAGMEALRNGKEGDVIYVMEE